MSTRGRFDLTRLPPEACDLFFRLLRARYFSRSSYPPLPMSILETTYAVCQYPPKELDKKAEVKTSIDPMYILMRIMSSLPSDNDERDGMRCQISYLDNLHSQNARDPAPTYFYSKRVLEFLRSLHLIPGWKILQDGTLTAKTATAPLTLINNFFRTIPVPIASNFSIISIPLVSSFIGNTKSFHAEVIQMLRVLASRPPARDVKDMNIVIRPSSDILDWQDSLQHQKFEISGIAGMRIHLAVSYLGFRTMDAHVRSTIVKQMESLNTVLAASAGSCRAAIHGEPQPPRLIGLPNEVIGKILDQLLPHSSPDIIESHDETGRIRGSPSLSLLLASRSTSGCAQNHADRLLRTRVVRLSTKYGTESIRKYLVPTAIHYPLVNQITHFRIDMHHISMLCKSDAIDGTRHHAPKSTETTTAHLVTYRSYLVYSITSSSMSWYLVVRGKNMSLGLTIAACSKYGVLSSIPFNRVLGPLPIVTIKSTVQEQQFR